MTANPGGQADVAQLTAHVHEKDRQLQALKQGAGRKRARNVPNPNCLLTNPASTSTGYAQLKVKKDILVTEVKKLQNDTSRLGAENGCSSHFLGCAATALTVRLVLRRPAETRLAILSLTGGELPQDCEPGGVRDDCSSLRGAST